MTVTTVTGLLVLMQSYSLPLSQTAGVCGYSQVTVTWSS